MAYRTEKTKAGTDIVINGFEKGIASSPHLGIANLKCANISTDTGEVMANYARTQQSQPGNTTANENATRTDTSHLSTNVTLVNGQWITITNAGTTGISTGNYYIQNSNGTAIFAATSFQISSTFNGTVLTGFNAGTIVFNLLAVMGIPVQSDIEEYTDSNYIIQYRYYVLDQSGLLWVYDTAQVNAGSTGKILWVLPDPTNPDGLATLATGLAVYNGWVHVFKGNKIYCKLTTLLGVNPTSTGSLGWAGFTGGNLQTPPFSPNPHFAYKFQGEIIYTDTNFIGTLLALSNSGVPVNPNLFTYGSVTVTNASPSIFTLTQLSGQIPVGGQTVMFVSSGTPTNISSSTLYYIKNGTVSTSGGVITFQISTTPSGSALNSVSNTGTLYMNSYNPVNSAGTPTYAFSPTACILPSSEVATCITQLGLGIIIGGISSTMYTWDLGASATGTVVTDDQPTAFIPMPESNVQALLTVNIVVYAFVGAKGNIYVTNGSSLSLALTVPDYCAGIPSNSTPQYIEPYFVWGGAAINRGRIWFSIQDQTASKTGNCGGIWSFVPSFFNPVSGTDNGIALRLENQNSYGTYNGKANLIIPTINQNGLGPQYFSAWASDQNSSSASYGIDFTATTPVNQNNGATIVESDLLPLGTILGEQKRTFSSIEFKLTAPLQSGELVVINYRKNLTDAWAVAGTLQMDNTNLSGLYSPLAFEGLQWLQLQAVINSIGSNPSFCRLYEIRLHP